MYFLLPACTMVNFMGGGHWQNLVGKNGFVSRFQSMWLLQRLVPVITDSCSSTSLLTSVCTTSPVPHSCAAQQQEDQTVSTFTMVVLYWDTFGKHQYNLKWQEKRSRGQTSRKFHLCDTTIQFLCHSKSHGHVLPSRIWMSTKGWQACFLELSKYRSNDFSLCCYILIRLPNQALITQISFYNY